MPARPTASPPDASGGATGGAVSGGGRRAEKRQDALQYALFALRASGGAVAISHAAAQFQFPTALRAFIFVKRHERNLPG